MKPKELSELLHKLYSAAAAEELWPDFLRELGHHLNLNGASIIHHDMERGQYNVEFSWGNDEWKPGYATYYGQLDIWRPAFFERPAGQFSLGTELCPLHEARKTEFYQDYARQYDLELLGAIATIKQPQQFETINLYQGWQEQRSNPSAVETMELLFPHLQMALNLRRKFVALRTYVSTLEGAFDLANTAIVILDRQGRVVRLNKSAESLLSAREGLTIREGYLQTASAAEHAAMKVLVRRVIAGRCKGELYPGGSMLVTRPRRRPLALTVAPLISLNTAPPPGAAAILFIYDPDSRVRPPMDLLREGYQLTAAEARVAVLLFEGRSVSEVAKSGDVKVNTVRQQLKSIFRKTGTRHQAELIRLLMRTFLSN